MASLAEVFSRYGPAYLDKYGPAVLPSHRRAITDILRCRTPEMGGEVFFCPHCEHTHYVYHSCRNRSCPQCHGQQTEAWLDQRRQELLAVPYFHVVFTIASELNVVFLYNRKLLELFAQSSSTLLDFARNPKYLGAQLGFL